MAEEEGTERTEDPTPRRREEAREKGQLAYSSDLTGAVVLLAGVVGLTVLGPHIGGGLLDLFRTDLSQLYPGDLTTVMTRDIFWRFFLRGLSVLGGFLILLVICSLAVNLVQVGLHLSPEKLEPDFEKLNPASGLKKLFSFAAVVKGILVLLKITALAVLAGIILRGRVGTITSLGFDSLEASAANSWSLTMRLALYLSSVLVLLGAIDYIYQKQRFENSLKMTKQEIKEELKRDEGDPLIKQRIRALARERARQKMLSAVPKATVVITNPQHYSVALRYRAGEDEAPVLLAKGRGAFAKRIAKIARDNEIPVLERPPLARAIFRTVEDGKAIPQELFQAVAEVIALVLRLRQNVVRG
jgi:flagellar biosynthetic protein FlhB